jgi:hypothetical protein
LRLRVRWCQSADAVIETGDGAGPVALPQSRAGEQGGGVSFRLQPGKPVGTCRICSLRATFGNGVLAGMDVLEQPVGLGEMPGVELGYGALLQGGDLRRIEALRVLRLSFLRVLSLVRGTMLIFSWRSSISARSFCMRSKSFLERGFDCL